MNADSLIKIFDYNAQIIRKQCDGLTHEESLVAPVTDGHSINWLLGHLVSTRTILLERVGANAIWDDATRARYRNGSDPISSDGEGVIALQQLLADFNESHTRLISGLPSLTPEALAAPSGHRDNTMYESFQYYHFHETYHTGQLTQVAAHLGKATAYVSFD